MGEHFSPDGPIVGRPGADIQPVRDSFLVQDLGHPFVLSFAEILFGSSQDDLHIVKMLVLGIGHEIRGAVKIDVFVEIAIHMLFDIECAAHTEQVGYLLRVAERKVKGVIASETAPGYAYFIDAAFKPDFRNKFLVKHPVVLNVIEYPVFRMEVLGIPAIAVDAVDAIELDLSGFNEPTRRFHELEILILVIPAHGGRKNDHRIPPISKLEIFDFSPKGMRIKVVIGFVQSKGFLGLKNAGGDKLYRKRPQN